MTTENTGSGGFLGRIKDALFTEEGVKPAAQPKPASVDQGSAPTAAVQAPTAANTEMISQMMRLVLNKPTAYTALVEALQPLENFIPDEASRYKAAFAIVGRSRTVEQIVQSIDLQHLPELEAESQRFQGQAKSREGQEINARLAEIETLTSSISSLEDETKRLEARLAEIRAKSEGARTKIAELQRDIAAKKNEIELVNLRFEDAMKTVKSTLSDAKAKVLKYLAG